VDLDFSPYDDSVQADPYPIYARLRDEAPAYRNDQDDFWALSRHADVHAAIKDSERYSHRNGTLLEKRNWGPGASRYLSFLAMDPPRHTVLRAMAAAGFTPARVSALEPRIREITRTYLDSALQRGTFDFITDFAVPLPRDVISELIGVPEADRPEIRRLVDLTVHRDEGSRDIPPETIEAVLNLVTYYRDLIDDRRRHGRDDFTSALLDAAAAADPDDRPTDDEVISMVFLLTGAGNETTTHLLGNAWHAAWQHSDQKPAALGGRITEWTDETLRFDPPAQSVVRTAATDLRLHGHTIPADERVLLLIGAAHHDPAAFDQPHQFRLDRDPGQTRRVIAFGLGPHYCLGAPLARLEAHIALSELVKATRDYDIDLARTTRVRSAHVRGFLSLPTTISIR
jgi:cytochrome P450